MTSIGPFLDELGVTQENVFERLPQLESLTNGQVYELTRFVKSAKIPWQEIRTRMRGAENLTDGEFCPAMASKCHVVRFVKEKKHT